MEDAVDATRSIWIRRILEDDEPADASAWAFRVAVNHVKRVGSGALAYAEAGLAVDEQSGSVPGSREKLRSRFRHMRKKLTPVQARVVEKLAEPGMSKHRAAKELGMDRSNLRRAFQRALTTLGQREGGR